MGNPNPSPSTRFVAGSRGNPGAPGRPRLPEDLIGIAPLTSDEIQRTFAKYMRMSVEEINEFVKAKKGKLLDFAICSGLCRGVEKGDFTNLCVAFDRTIGRLRDTETPQEQKDLDEVFRSVPREAIIKLITET